MLYLLILIDMLHNDDVCVELTLRCQKKRDFRELYSTQVVNFSFIILYSSVEYTCRNVASRDFISLPVGKMFACQKFVLREPTLSGKRTSGKCGSELQTFRKQDYGRKVGKLGNYTGKNLEKLGFAKD